MSLSVTKRLLISAILLGAAGCGSGVNPLTPTLKAIPDTTPAAASSAGVTGNWQMIQLPTLTANVPLTSPPVSSLTGFLNATGTAITGTLHVTTLAKSAKLPNSTCAGKGVLFSDMPVTGTVTPAGLLTLSGALAGGTLTINSTLPQDLHSFIPASFQIVGGTCATPAAALTIAQIAPVTGTFQGTFTAFDPQTKVLTPGTATTVTAVLTQSTTANAAGEFPILGAISATGACTASIPLTAAVLSGGSLSTHTAALPVPPGELNGNVDPPASTINGVLGIFSGCRNATYEGTLSRL